MEIFISNIGVDDRFEPDMSERSNRRTSRGSEYQRMIVRQTAEARREALLPGEMRQRSREARVLDHDQAAPLAGAAQRLAEPSAPTSCGSRSCSDRPRPPGSVSAPTSAAAAGGTARQDAHGHLIARRGDLVDLLVDEQRADACGRSRPAGVMGPHPAPAVRPGALLERSFSPCAASWPAGLRVGARSHAPGGRHALADAGDADVPASWPSGWPRHDAGLRRPEGVMLAACTSARLESTARRSRAVFGTLTGCTPPSTTCSKRSHGSYVAGTLESPGADHYDYATCDTPRQAAGALSHRWAAPGVAFQTRTPAPGT